MRNKISAIILSAGFSSRMGIFKPALQIGNKTILEHAVSLFLSAGIDDIRVVIGHRGDELPEIYNNPVILWIKNPDYEKGMFTSIQAGIGSLENCDAFFILPVDIPLIRPHTINLIFEAYNHGDTEIIYPVFNGLRGHPPLISGNFAKEILEYDGEGGLKKFLMKHERNAMDIPVADEGILLDCDTQSDYEFLVKRYENREIPSESEFSEFFSIYKADNKIEGHCRQVASLACFIGKAINLPEYELRLTEAGGLLHDIARKEHRHDEAGALLMEKHGFSEIAYIIRNHINININKNKPVNPSELVYLADKLIKGTELVGIENRFSGKLNGTDDPEVLNAVKKRMDNALIIQKRVEEASGISLDDILIKYKNKTRL